MARSTKRLTARTADAIRAPGYHHDGAGLYLQVTAAGGRSWVYRYTIRGRTREMGLGSARVVGLAEARERAATARRLITDGVDPLEKRAAEDAAAAVAQARLTTFDEAADQYIASHQAGWRNEKHAAQWTATLRTYASPVFGALPVAEVDTTLVMKVLDPIWRVKPETASRLRGRIEAILDWSRVRGLRSGENPARWRGHLDVLLPARTKVRKVEHHAAMPFTEVPTFFATLGGREGVAAQALAFLILTAGRTGEVLGARWEEIDREARVWTIPAERMKARTEHRVPLSDAALAILNEMFLLKDEDGFVFPGQRRGKPLSNMAMLVLLRRMDRGDLTAHGFRSTFRDWAAERTTFPGEVAEAALAHTIGDKTEAAYRRGDLFGKRRKLMDAWASYCTKPPAAGSTVTPFARQPALRA